MTFRQIFKRARRGTQFLRWKEELVSALAIGGITYLALRLSGGTGADETLWGVGAAVVAFVFLLAAEFVWNLALAPFRLIQEDLAVRFQLIQEDVVARFQRHEDRIAWLSERVGPETTSERWRLHTPVSSLRVALYAVRSELAACAIRIQETRARRTWWNPKHDPLPASKWEEHFATLADPELPLSVHERIEAAYQHCDRLNHLAGRYEAEPDPQHPFLLMGTTVLSFRVGDDELLKEAEAKIRVANSAITTHLDATQTKEDHGPENRSSV